MNSAVDIYVTIKNNFGQDAVYPACDKAKIFASIAGTKTLSHSTINSIKALGYTVNVKQAPATL